MTPLGRMIAMGTALAVLANGCSSKETTAIVAGTVTLDGAALKSGQIRFIPDDGRSPTAGAVIVEGRYTATITPGTKTIEISSPMDGPARSMYDEAPPSREVGGDLVPARYNARSELTLEVRPGDQEHNFELTSK
jgi:hypothetical protein